MSQIIVAMLVGTIVYAVCQAWVIRQFRNCYARQAPIWPNDKPWPKAAIVLSLRGGDPFLTSCLEHLLQQDYPDFVIQIVIDSESDPAWDSIRAVRERFGQESLNVSVLHRRISTCSLKNSSIIQAIESLPPDCEVVAFVDADAVVHSRWLRELVAPLADPEVGGCSGVRWFAPTDRSFGSKLRCHWNLVAASMMYVTDTPWGGSMCVRRSILDSGLTKEWSRMLCEDVHTFNHLQERGLKLSYAPKATVINRESISTVDCFRFVNRQMLFYGLYHRHWKYLAAYITYAAALSFAYLYFLVSTAIHCDWAACLALFCIRKIILLTTRYEGAKLEQAVREVVTSNGQTITKNPLPGNFGFTCTQVLFLTSMLCSFAARFVSWRGIRYRIKGPNEITLESYRPYIAARAKFGSNQSTVV